MSQRVVDFAVIGGGLVGLATAWQLNQRYPDARLCLLEKESAVGQHQSGRNSGVLHSGIYYKPGSLKATTCRAGKQLMEQFCAEENIPYDLCGKIIVALDEVEVGRLDAIYERGQANGVRCAKIDGQQIRELEPHAAGLAAIHVPESGIVDYPAVCRRLSEKLTGAGQEVLVSSEVRGIHSSASDVRITTDQLSITAGQVITCGGLYSDRLVRLSGMQPLAKIVPFRGEYYELKPERRQLCRNLIYPVPDPNFPFLGVHFTRMIDGSVECGPNAVLALAREGYSWSHVRLGDLTESLTYGGFVKLATKYWRTGLGEIHRSLSKAAFVKALSRLIPELHSSDLHPCRAGVRAQAVAPDGTMVDDFLWLKSERILHVCNAPSPAATASLEIGRRIVERLDESD
ncbi:MAG: L-2-hydroxyglutarate oxidase [Pirellulaceae bacterium]|nr:L-2-hydroxyglutarate oxidase [Pirellulaceae bacterium]